MTRAGDSDSDVRDSDSDDVRDSDSSDVRESDSGFVRVARADDVASGDVVAVTARGVDMVIGRVGERWFALQRWCLHQRADLGLGILSDGHLICPQHAWRWSVETGCHDMSPEMCLVRYAVRISDGHVEVDPTPIRAARSPWRPPGALLDSGGDD